MLQTARIVAITHHEKWDGTGYPKKLRGEEIPLSGRIVAMADVFDALTSDRPYKKAWFVENAVREIEKCSGTHFAPELIEPFNAALPEIIKIMEQYSDKHGALNDLDFIRNSG